VARTLAAGVGAGTEGPPPPLEPAAARTACAPAVQQARPRAGSATEARASANMPVAQGCGCEAAITGMSCKPVHWSTLAALRLTGLPVQIKPQSL
jgi:hypothetical protein